MPAPITVEHMHLNKPSKPRSHAHIPHMIARNAEPIGHISPYPRIDRTSVRPASGGSGAKSNAGPRHRPTALEESKRIAEIDRIWRLVVQASETS
jgi:hypothetical protein